MSVDNLKQKLHIKILMFRYGLRMSSLFTDIASDLLGAWKFLRSYPDYISDVYARLKVIAEKRGVKVPKPKIDMGIEGEIDE